MQQLDLLRTSVEVLESIDTPYMLAGSYASAAHGEPRMSMDIDFVIDPAGDDIDRLCSEFGGEEFMIRHLEDRLHILHLPSGHRIDFIFARDDPHGRAQLERRKRIDIFPDLAGFIASPEDVIISKMCFFLEGGDDRQLRDAAGALKISGKEVDRDYIGQWADKLGLNELWKLLAERVDT